MSRKRCSYSENVTTNGTSSAFSSSANPDEDWTRISDPAERRRIQNRIAQRNYRKKLKRRLELLERRAGLCSGSPPQTHVEIHQPQRANESSQQYKRSPESRQQQLSSRLLPSQCTPPMGSDDVMSSHSYERDGSRTPPLFAYHHTYLAPEDVIYPAYPHSQPYLLVSSSGNWSRPESDYLAPVTLPSMMQFHDSIVGGRG